MTRKYQLSKAEMETTINFDREGEGASLYTADSVMMTKLDKLCESSPENYKVIRQDDISKTYEFPKKLITLRKSSIKKQLTDEEREILSERMKDTLHR